MRLICIAILLLTCFIGNAQKATINDSLTVEIKAFAGKTILHSEGQISVKEVKQLVFHERPSQSNIEKMADLGLKYKVQFLNNQSGLSQTISTEEETIPKSRLRKFNKTRRTGLRIQIAALIVAGIGTAVGLPTLPILLASGLLSTTGLVVETAASSHLDY